MLSQADMDAIERKALEGLRAKLGVRAGTLPRAMKRAGRRMPREAHRAADVLASAKSQASHPRLSRLIDETSVTAAQTVFEAHLNNIDPKKRRTDRILSMLGTQAFNVLAVGALFIAVLYWRGFL